MKKSSLFIAAISLFLSATVAHAFPKHCAGSQQAVERAQANLVEQQDILANRQVLVAKKRAQLERNVSIAYGELEAVGVSPAGGALGCAVGTAIGGQHGEREAAIGCAVGGVLGLIGRRAVLWTAYQVALTARNTYVRHSEGLLRRQAARVVTAQREFDEALARYQQAQGSYSGCY